MISIAVLSFPTDNSIENKMYIQHDWERPILYLPPIVYGTIHEMVGMLSRLVNAVELVPVSKTSYSYDPEPSPDPESAEEEDGHNFPSIHINYSYDPEPSPNPGSAEEGDGHNFP